VKKALPIILVVVGLLVVGGVFALRSFFSGPSELVEDQNIPDVPVEQRPFTSMTPSEDGHWLKLRIESVNVKGSASFDYELLYTRGDGLQQGVPGNIKYNSNETIERDLLLGSESSGKFRYDEGVQEGMLTLRFRDEKGKLIGKLKTDFHLQTDVSEATAVDGSASFDVSDADEATWFVVMQTFGTKDGYGGPASAQSDGYAVFSSDGEDYN